MSNSAEIYQTFDYAKIGLSDDQYHCILKSFMRYDIAKTGYINTMNFKNLSLDLGETFDEEELSEAISFLSDKESDKIEFQDFMNWWMEA